MKKIVQVSTLVVMTFVLGACSPNKSSEETEALNFTITLTEEGKEISSQELSFTAGDFLQDVMEEYFDIIEENGMIMSIDGHDSDASKQKYWMYDVNGEEAQVGAKEFELSDNDEVLWNLSVLDF